ncbi:DUF1902 domain-containing protein [Fulvimarina endophytica]|nr:DUF1902 domain-containing protein [Fulvimarina endophytica]
MKRSFRVKAFWDAEAGVYVSESDIDGLHIEAETIEGFEAVMVESALDLILANHLTPEDLATTPLRDLIPAIFWERPEANVPRAA